MRIWISVGRADIETSEKGAAAFKGKDNIFPIDFVIEGTQPLIGALYGNHLELAIMIYNSGSPVSNDIYAVAFNHLPQFLPYLPPNQEFIDVLVADRNWSKLNWAIIDEDVHTVRELLKTKMNLDREILITHGMGAMAPIFYAIRKANPKILKLIINSGADVNRLNANKISPLRALLEDELVETKKRRQCFSILKSAGAKVLPMPKSFFEKMRARFGFNL